MIIFSHKVTPRLQYVALFLSDYYQHPFNLTSDGHVYDNEQDFKIIYAEQRFSEQDLHIRPHTLLFETDKKKFTIECFSHNNYVAFFKAPGDMAFDLFASIFFLLSRYEEYLPHQKNKHGLFSHTNSLAFKEGFLRQPLVNIWLEEFRQVLQRKFAGIILQIKGFQFIPTYDIDLPWCFKEKSLKVHYGNLIRSALKGQLKKAQLRINVVNGNAKDPYDSYEWMDSLHDRFHLSPVYFLLVALKRGKHDKNPGIKNPQFRKLIRTLSQKYKTGLHPSWHSGDHEESLTDEKAVLEEVAGYPIDSSRQHFLRFELPHTFQCLQSAGIMHDYSMGYSAVNGFRASIASDFYWYDLQKEETTGLKIHPFCFMDASSFYYGSQSPGEAYEELMYYYATIKKVNGTMITLWHNNFLGTSEEFCGWKEAYEHFITSVCGSLYNLVD